MIVDSFGRYLAQTVHDHESTPGGGRGEGFEGRAGGGVFEGAERGGEHAGPAGRAQPGGRPGRERSRAGGSGGGSAAGRAAPGVTGCDRGRGRGPSGGGGGRACCWAGRVRRPRSWSGWCARSGRRPSRPRRPPRPAWWSARPRRSPAGRCWWSRRGRDRCTNQFPGTSMACTRRPTNSGGYAPAPASAMNAAAASGWRIHCSACRSVAISCRIITSAWSSSAR